MTCSKAYVPLLILPDQEELQGIDDGEKAVIENKRQFPDADSPRQ